MKYKKYFRKTSLKQNGVGEFFLNEVKAKSPKTFLEVGVFHGVTARNICELLYSIHKDDFRYIGLDLFEINNENKSEVIPNTFFSNPLKNIYFKFIKKQNPYSKEAVEDLLKKYKNNVTLIKGNSNLVLKKMDMSNQNYYLQKIITLTQFQMIQSNSLSILFKNSMNILILILKEYIHPRKQK